MCESCILCDDAACPNQAYCSPWKAINFQTGKPLLDDKFKNLHWPLPLLNNRNDRLSDSCDSLSNSVSDSSVMKHLNGILCCMFWRSLTLTLI